jgi:hypothetical protein
VRFFERFFERFFGHTSGAFLCILRAFSGGPGVAILFLLSRVFCCAGRETLRII